MIVAEGLQKRYTSGGRPLPVLRSINFEVAQESFVSVVGPSGSGKTTLLGLLAGLDEPTAGRVYLDGVDIFGLTEDGRAEFRSRNVGFVFQTFHLLPTLTAIENVLVPLELRGDYDGALDQAEDLLVRVGLAERLAHYPAQLSGGEQQRVALARSLIMKPKVLLLDEPLSSLDKNLREQMQVELRHLQRTVGITFILVTHDQEEALTMSDRTAVMFDGQIVQIATPQEIYSRPKSKRVASFIGVMNFIEGKLLKDSDQNTTLDAGILGNVKVNQEQMPVPLDSGPVTIGIRPEMLTLLFEEQDRMEFEISGEILESAYFGDMTYYTVQVPGLNSSLTISMRNTAGRRVLEDGESARVGWEAESLVILNKSEL